VASGCTNGAAYVWNTASGHCLLALKGARDAIWSLSCFPEGTKPTPLQSAEWLVASSRDKTARVYQLEASVLAQRVCTSYADAQLASTEPVHMLQAHALPILCMDCMTATCHPFWLPPAAATTNAEKLPSCQSCSAKAVELPSKAAELPSKAAELPSKAAELPAGACSVHLVAIGGAGAAAKPPLALQVVQHTAESTTWHSCMHDAWACVPQMVQSPCGRRHRECEWPRCEAIGLACCPYACISCTGRWTPPCRCLAAAAQPLVALADVHPASALLQLPQPAAAYPCACCCSLAAQTTLCCCGTFCARHACSG
jgi:hypothetical protein